MASHGGIHYIDDFLTIGALNSLQCFHNVAIMEAVCEQAGLPTEPTKSVGPASTIVFLGIEIDTIQGGLRLPVVKLTVLKDTLRSWRGATSCRKEELQSLNGLLAYASKVVKESRIFLRRLIDLASKFDHPDHKIRLNVEARSDIEWWFQFAEPWNGVSILDSLVPKPPEHTLTSDASGSWGCGAFWESHWFQLEWAGILTDVHISIKELIPITGRGTLGSLMGRKIDTCALG